MSMPSIPNITPNINITREDAFNMILASIAMEEMGLAHIINAEGEKIQYILDTEKHGPVSICEIKEINLSVERVLREAMKLQMLLQEKLENVTNYIPKPCPPPKPPCPPPKPPCPPPKPPCRPGCALTGYGEGQIVNGSEPFRCGSASIESGICATSQCHHVPALKYSVCKQYDRKSVSAILLAIPGSIEVKCSGGSGPCSSPQEHSALIMTGEGVMALSGSDRRLQQCCVEFKLIVWENGCNTKFQMVINSESSELEHDSGIVTVKTGTLNVIEIKHP